MDFIIENGVLITPVDKNITSAIIPDEVTSIGESAFAYCSSLTSITIPDSVTHIGAWAFRGCCSLTSVTIPDGVTSIGDYTFWMCSSLTSIAIPDSVTSIGNLAFYGCENLTDITIPDGITNIGYSAFLGCKNLTSKISNYKAFHLHLIDDGLRCRYTFFTPMCWSKEVDDIKLCRRGYHYCTNLFDIFNYYHGVLDIDIAIYECEVGDVVCSKDDGDSKHVTNTIKPVKRLYREDIIRILNGQD